jgi:hypothetical protein
MLLDIGAKTSNLLFFEKGKVFSRSISLGANSITQDFANESKLKFDPAEKIKIEEGFVSLGGAYEEPENPNQAAISKIARQFMTRLHIQVNQTLQFYRGQQGGSAPQRLFLAGGASLMPYTAQFFAEKLNVPVEYLNPFRAVQIDPAVNLEELAKNAHALGEVVGLGLRNLATCPVELNLMPESTLRWQSFNQKKPYFIATVFSLVAMAFAVGFLFNQLAQVKRQEAEKVESGTPGRPGLVALRTKDQQFKRAHGELKTAQTQLDQLTCWMADRYHWVDLLQEIRGVLIRVEEIHRRKHSADTGLWLENLQSYDPLAAGPAAPSDPFSAPTPAPTANPELDRAFMERYGITPGRRAVESAPSAVDPANPGGTNDPNAIIATFRGVSLDHITPTANRDLAFAVQTELKASALLDGERTRLNREITLDETNFTFTFSMSLGRKPQPCETGNAAAPVPDPNAPPADPNAPPP